MMNIEFIKWLKQQHFVFNPVPREKGWIIWEVNRDMLLKSELEYIKYIKQHKWKWDDILNVGGPGREIKPGTQKD